MSAPITKHFDAGDWKTAELTVNLKCIACFKGPAGVRIKSRVFLFFNADEQVLDGVNYKRLILTFGKVQVLVPSPMNITYSWDPLEGRPAVNFPAIPF